MRIPRQVILVPKLPSQTDRIDWSDRRMTAEALTVLTFRSRRRTRKRLRWPSVAVSAGVWILVGSLLGGETGEFLFINSVFMVSFVVGVDLQTGK